MSAYSRFLVITDILLTMASAQATPGVTELEPPPTDLITLTRHILSQQYALGEAATGDLTMLLVAIQVSCG